MPQAVDLSGVYDRVLTERARTNDRIFTVDAEGSWMVAQFRAAFPDRAIQVGIAEQNMIGIAAGLAARGKTVFANCMATFQTMRACEHIKADVVYNRFHVKLAATFAGLLGGPYGATHHALEDIAITRAIPDIDIVVPADAAETAQATEAIIDRPGCVYLRLGFGKSVNGSDYRFEFGRAVTLRDGGDVTLIAIGSMVERSLAAAKLLAADGVEARVLNMHTVKPIDRQAIVDAAGQTGRIVTVEEHNIIGGLGSAVAEVVAEESPTYVKRIGTPDTLCHIIGTYDQLLTHFGLTPQGIAEQTLEFLRTE